MITQPDKILLSGDKVRGVRFIGRGHSEMFLLENAMSFQKLDQSVRVTRPEDGVIIKCTKVFGQKNIHIYVQPRGGPVPPLEIPINLVKIFVHIDMINHEDWSSGTVDGVAWYDRVVREDVVSAVACGVVNLANGKVLWSAVKEPYSETYDCNLLAEHSGTNWEGVYSILDTAENANLVLNYYNTLFADSAMYESEIPVIENKWIKTKTPTGATVAGTENYAVTSVLTSGYSSVYTSYDGELIDWNKTVYSNNSSSVWLTPPNFIEYTLFDRYYLWATFLRTSIAGSYKMPVIRYQELLDDGVTYDERKYAQWFQTLIRHDWHGGGSGSHYGASEAVDNDEIIDGEHRAYRMRHCPIVGYTWCLPDEQQVAKIFSTKLSTFDDYPELYATLFEDYLVRGLHRTMPTYSTVINRYAYRGSQMTPANNHIMFENGNCYEQNYELSNGFSWYIATAGGNITHRNYSFDYTYFNRDIDLSGDYTLTETVRGLYNVCALAGKNLPKWGERHMNPINGAIKQIAGEAITYLGGVIYDNADIPLDIPAVDAEIINGPLEFATIDFKTVPGLLYCSPLFNIRINCIPVKKKLMVPQ